MIKDKVVQEYKYKDKTQKLYLRPHAWNLQAPTHMEGKIKDATKGGDLSEARPVVQGLEGPSSMTVLADGRMLVTEFWGGRIREIVEGSHADGLPLIAEGLKGPYSLAQDRNGRLAVTVRETKTVGRSVEIDLVTGEIRTLVEGTPLIAPQGFHGFAPSQSFPDDYRLYASCNDWKTVINAAGMPYTFALAVTDMVVLVPEESRTYSFNELVKNHLLAYGLGWTGGMIQHPHLDTLYITQPLTGSVTALNLRNLENDATFAPPVIKNLPLASCVRFDKTGETMFVCSPENGVIWKVEGAVEA